MSVTSLDGDCYIIGGITEQQNKGASAANKAENGTTNSESEGSDESGNSGENFITKKEVQEVEMFLMEELLLLVLPASRMLQMMKKFQVLPIRVRFQSAARRFLIT